jgi:predicted DNA-binding transcriptional regulator AlpA
MTTLRVELAAGRFPKPVQLTVGRQVWLRDHLDEWLDMKAALGVAPNPWHAAM